MTVQRSITLLTVLAFVAAGSGRSAASTSFPPALADALVRDPDVATCAERARAASNVAYANANFQLSRVTLRSGPQLSVVTGGGSCVCGNANCKVEVFRQDGGAFKPVLSEYAIDWSVRPNGTAVITSHDSADIVDRTSYRWNGTLYAVTNREVVYLPRNVAKPLSRKVRFVPGTSSAILTGDKLALGFEDRFDLVAASGQTLTLTLVRGDSHFGSFSLRGSEATLGAAKRGSLTVKLPASGAYYILVEGADESFSKYALKVAIH